MRCVALVASVAWFIRSADAQAALPAATNPGFESKAVELPVTTDESAPPGEHRSKRNKRGPRILTFVLIEGFVGANSLIAAQDPHAFGVAALALTPLSLILDRTDHRGVLTSIEPALMFAAIGTYNLTLHDDQLGKKDVFWRNVVAWHVVVATVWLGGRLAGANRDVSGSAVDGTSSSWSTSFGVARSGAGLSVTRRF